MVCTGANISRFNPSVFVLYFTEGGYKAMYSGPCS